MKRLLAPLFAAVIGGWPTITAATAKPTHDPQLQEIHATAGALLLQSMTWTKAQGGTWPQAVQTAVRAVLRAGAGPELPLKGAESPYWTVDPGLADIEATAGTLLLMSQTWSGGDQVRAMQTATRAVFRAAAGPELPMGDSP